MNRPDSAAPSGSPWRLTALAFLVTAGALACSEGETPVRPDTRESLEQVSQTAASSHESPTSVTDLGASVAGGEAVRLEWTEVPDGRGEPAAYQIRYASTPIGWGWGQATVVRDGACGDPVEGSEVGASISCVVEGLETDRSYDFQLVAFRARSDGNRVYSPDLSNVATAETTPGVPGTVTDLTVADVTSSSVTLEWTAVGDGTGEEARYTVRRAPTPIGHGWGQATILTEGECAAPVEGGPVGSTISCTVTGLSENTSHDFQLVSYRIATDGGRTYSDGLSNAATARTEPKAPENPETVRDLSVSGYSVGSATLTWTEVGDGAGAPASYQIRYTTSPIGYGWGSATTVRSGECASPIRGERIGNGISCTVTGLDAGTTYDFQLVAFRDEDGGRTYSGLSNVATGTTAPASGGSDGNPDPSGDGSGGTLPSSGDYPAEPAGFSPVTETSYSSTEENGWRSHSDLTIVTDTDAPRSPSSVGQALFPAGWTGGYAPIWSEEGITSAGKTELYVSFWLKLSDNWQGHPVNDKLLYFWTHEDPVVFPVYVGGGDAPLHTQVRIQDVPDGARNLRPNVTDVTIRRGEWHRWEVLVVSNTGDAADGEIHWWLDGRKVGEHRDVRFGTSSQSKIWNYVSWRPVWGGAGSEIQEDQYMWMDHIYVSGGP